MRDDEGWRAELSLRFSARGGRTVLSERRHTGPLMVQRPFYPERDVCHAYILHPPGGVAGGDSLHLDVSCDAGAHALLTTPAATKFYRSDGKHARQRQTLRVDPDASLEWLPQESIWFSGARAQVTTRVELARDASFIGWESLCLGRPASGERFTAGQAQLGLEIWRGGVPLLIERLRTAGGDTMLDSRWGMQGYPFAATLVAVHADQLILDRLRDAVTPHIDGTWAATLIDDLLIARYLGPAAEDMRLALTTAWMVLRSALLGREPCVPRIWAT